MIPQSIALTITPLGQPPVMKAKKKIIVYDLYVFTQPLCYGQDVTQGQFLKLSTESVRQWPRRPGFNPRLSHTKDFKNGT